MRLALITSRFPRRRAETFLREEIVELSRHHDVTVIPAVPRMFAPSTLLAALREWLRAPRAAASLLWHVAVAPRSLHARLKNVAIFPQALATARRLRREGIEHVHAYWLSAPATIAYVASEMNGIPWSATGHRYDLVDFNMSAAPPYAGFLRHSRFVRAISSSGGEAVRRALGEQGRERVKDIHLGVRIPPAAVRPRSGRPLRLICAAALVPVKDHATLLSALRVAVDCNVQVQCDIAGDGVLRHDLMALAAILLPTGTVSFAGHVPHEKLLEQLSCGEYDAGILTSEDRGLTSCEGIPVFLMEAMAAGLPCIATSSGSVVELVRDGENGVLCRPGDCKGIGRGIATLANDVQLRERLGDAARDTIMHEFSAVDCAARLSQLFEPSFSRQAIPA